MTFYVFSRLLYGVVQGAAARIHGHAKGHAARVPKKAQDSAWRLFASLVWGGMMVHYGFDEAHMHRSMQSSMTYLYRRCDEWTSLKTLLWHNE